VNKGNRSIRLIAVAVGVFGFAASLTAFAGPWGCDHCLPAYYACQSTPDPNPSCLEQFWQCQMDNGCIITMPE
jgi:hypothetical protein